MVNISNGEFNPASRIPGSEPGTARLDPTNAAPLTHALARHPVMGEGEYRGSTLLSRESSVVLQFMPSGLCHVLVLNEPVTLGRVTEVMNLPIIKAQRHGVSREHCRLRREGQSLVLTDLGSTNGTTLNGDRLLPHQDYLLADGDQVALGTLHLSVHFGALTR